AIRRILPEIDLDEDEIPEEVLEQLKVTRKDFEEALKEVKPSALREVFVEVPSVHWEDVGGLEDVKAKLREAVEWPLRFRESFEAMGIKPPKGILLYGPPGTGKTLLAKAVATESEANFISVKGPEVLSKWVGESERAIREIFTKARQAAPCVVFIDEIDAIAPRRGGEENHVTDRIVNQLLTEMDGISELKDVVVIAATNRPDIVDPSLLRPGRFDRIIYVPPPDENARLEILKVHTRNVPLAEDVDLETIARETENYTGADLEALVREAALTALRRNKMKPTKVTMDDFRKAMEVVGPSLDKDTVAFYEAFSKMLSQRVVKRLISKKSKEPDYFG
ncbi:MAG: transitional endoplasmic reticulum ATPase, partial [Candidatus Diapherotrites archaeon]|nr:transitional endoplasmic reticulum ATPase [Candidatus Diapherotrites archaeon]MDN5367131.1 transitional endoplasmic reticulum ATPase [Candidatus Diapherotrites archaeon]